MAIDTVTTQLLDTAGGEASRKAPGSSDRWLAALEEESFKVTDDNLQKPAGDEDAKEEPDLPREDTGQAVGAIEGPAPTQLPPLTGAEVLKRAMAEAGVRAASPAAPQAPTPGPNAAATAMTPPVPRPMAPTPGPNLNSPSLVGPQLDAILNQARFMDVNLQLTRSGKQSTLWIRDFKHKYAREIHSLVQDLQAALAEQGRNLDRIVLNGRPLHHINDILGN